MSTGSQGLEPSSDAFPGHKLGDGSETEQPGLEPVPTGILELKAERLAFCATAPAPFSFITVSFSGEGEGTFFLAKINSK